MKTKEEKELEFLRGMEKLKAAPIKDSNYRSPLNQDVMPVRGGQFQSDSVMKIPGVSQKLNTNEITPIISGNQFADKISKLKVAKTLGKKLLGVLPFAGAGAAALSGDPAMAAEELAQDAMGPAGIAYDAIRPEQAGNPEEEQMMLAERNALEDYKNSPASISRFANIRASLGKK